MLSEEEMERIVESNGVAMEPPIDLPTDLPKNQTLAEARSIEDESTGALQPAWT